MNRLDCYSRPNKRLHTVPLVLLMTTELTAWLATQTTFVTNWVKTLDFTAAPDTWCAVPDKDGHLALVIVGITKRDDFWNMAGLSFVLPVGHYAIHGVEDPKILQQLVIVWGLGAYQFTRYKAALRLPAKLMLPKNCDQVFIQTVVQSIFLVRDLINTPTEHMGPAELAQAAVTLGKEFSAKVNQVTGDALIKKNYPAIHTVGRASTRVPRLIDLQWGKTSAPKLTLIGKGVCFDSGGLDLKPASNMALMKKDMGGAAHVLGLARLIMALRLPVRLRVLIPAVENVISGNAYRPGDVITTRKGLTVEIGNTDAEGRVVLADVLTEAASEQPDLMIDFATLTGAARVALGTDMPVLFCNRDDVAQALLACAQHEQDPLWCLPLYSPYRKLINSTIADINNAGNSSYAGAITAALFLKEFVPDEVPWMHIDLMAWNLCARAGRPEGGEAMGLRAVFSYLQKRYSDKYIPLCDRITGS